ncbi:MAG TPA: extracellular solute-binding protein [Phototrophicaceae bacterium]|nr:extracellular solute-binding protein [Phototrophicaceae bacterium]
MRLTPTFHPQKHTAVRQLTGWYWGGLILLAGLLPACSGQGVQITTEPLPLPTFALATSTPPLALTPEVTAAAPVTLTIWWPEPLAPVGDVEVAAVLSQQTNTFEATYTDVIVESRLKKPGDVGGIMETLRTASAVAPGALPDLTLLRREDLLAAVQAGLVQPLEGLVSSAILGDLYTAALELGQVDGQLYGLPYLLEVQHIAYWGDAPSGDYATFENVLAQKRPFVFPASGADGISPVVLLQYLSAGGSLADISVGEINEDALRAVLTFYEQAAKDEVVDATILNYASYRDYLPALQDESVAAAVVPSSVYLNLGAQEQPLAFAPVPVQAGQPTTILNGWLWVMTAKNANDRTAAANFLNWMVDVERQSQYSQALHMLPSLRRGLRQIGINAAYSDFVTQLLGNAVLPVPELSNSATARAIQNALTAVISGQRTAVAATEEVLTQLSG